MGNSKSKKELIEEIKALRARMEELESSHTGRKKMEEPLSESEFQYRTTLDAVRESEEKFRSLAEQSPNMIFINKEGRVVYANKKCEEIMGYKREEFYSPDFDFLKLIAPQSLDLVKENFGRHSRGMDVPPYEYTIITKGGKRIEAINSCKLIRYEGRTAILGVVTDITERKKVEGALRESEEKYYALFHQSGNSMILADLETMKFVEFNDSAHNNLGYTREEFEKLEISDFEVIESPEEVKAHTQKLIDTGSDTFETKHRTKSGEIRDVIVNMKILSLSGKLYSQAIITDITKLRQMEEKLRSLASQLAVTEERERHRLAKELHDQVGQSLVLSKLKLDRLCNSPSSGDLVKDLAEISNDLEQVIDETTKLMFDMSYPVLHELGFEAAVAEWLEEQIRNKHGITTEFEDDGQTKALDDDIQTSLFRNVRELLINVVKHANAKNVKVSVRKADDLIYISVEDNGEGFDPADIASKTTFGLFSIRERLEQLGGSFEIKSEPGRGSKITMKAPLKRV